MPSQTVIVAAVVIVTTLVVGVIVYFYYYDKPSPGPPIPPGPTPVPPTPAPKYDRFMSFTGRTDAYSCAVETDPYVVAKFGFDIVTTQRGCFVAALTNGASGSVVVSLGDSGAIQLVVDIAAATEIIYVTTPPQSMLNDGAWHTIVVDFSVARQITWIVDKTSTTVPQSSGIPFPTLATDVTFGYHQTPSKHDAYGLPFVGCLNDVYIVDDKAATRYVTSGGSCAGAITANCASMPPPSRSTFTFNGSDDYLTAPTGHLQTPSFLVEFAFKSSKPSEFLVGMNTTSGFATGGGGGGQFAVWVSGDGSVVLVMNDAAGHSFDSSIIKSINVADNKWHWFSARSSSPTTIDIQIDIHGYTYDSITIPTIAPGPVYVGHRPAYVLPLWGWPLIGCVKDLQLSDGFLVTYDNSPPTTGSTIKVGCSS